MKKNAKPKADSANTCKADFNLLGRCSFGITIGLIGRGYVTVLQCVSVKCKRSRLPHASRLPLNSRGAFLYVGWLCLIVSSRFTKSTYLRFQSVFFAICVLSFLLCVIDCLLLSLYFAPDFLIGFNRPPRLFLDCANAAPSIYAR